MLILEEVDGIDVRSRTLTCFDLLAIALDEVAIELGYGLLQSRDEHFRIHSNVVDERPYLSGKHVHLVVGLFYRYH